jgi:hypothetical protein
MDLGGALKLIAAAGAESVRRYAMVSSMGAANAVGKAFDLLAAGSRRLHLRLGWQHSIT